LISDTSDISSCQKKYFGDLGPEGPALVIPRGDLFCWAG